MRKLRSVASALTAGVLAAAMAVVTTQAPSIDASWSPHAITAVSTVAAPAVHSVRAERVLEHARRAASHLDPSLPGHDLAIALVAPASGPALTAGDSFARVAPRAAGYDATAPPILPG